MPNVLMIAFDDLNDFTSVLGGYGGTAVTPNFDRLAAQTVTFSNAFCTSPSCNQSRTATLSGQSPLTTGIFANDQDAFDYVAPGEMLPALLQGAGWTTATAGKVFHKLPEEVQPQLYDTVLSTDKTEGEQDKNEDLVTRTLAPPLDGGVFNGDPETLADAINANAIAEFLAGYTPGEAVDAGGLFLSVGLSRPHSPWFVPQEYFDLYPIDSIILPPSFPDDLDDVPLFAQLLTDPEEVAQVVAAGEAKLLIQAYLAAVSFADAMLGRILDALEASAIADDTMIVLWSDHGYHLGEKDRIGKFTLWEEAARSQFAIGGTGAAAVAGRIEDQPVSLLDLLPTVLDYAGVAIPPAADGESLLDLVETGDARGLRGYATTVVRGSISVRDAQYRYSRYEDGSEELYDMLADPNAITNLAGDPAYATAQAELAALLAADAAALGFAQNTTATPTVLTLPAGGGVAIGGFGADTLVGNSGDNAYVVRTPETVIIEAANGGTDTVIARSAYTMADHIENMFIETWIGPDAPAGNIARTLRGNALANRIDVFATTGLVEGLGGNDTIIGEQANDHFRGNAGRDLLEGDSGADTLDGGAGNDVLNGELGDDTYILSIGIDTLRERPNGKTSKFKGETELGGTDRVDVTAWGRANTAIELLRDANGAVTAQVFRNTLTGDRAEIEVDEAGERLIEIIVDAGTQELLFATQVRGRAIADTMQGSAGDDTILADGGDDRIDGGAGRDSLAGEDGDDTLTGGGDADTLAGGAGDDTYVLTRNSGADEVSERRGSTKSSGDAGGLDTVDITAWGAANTQVKLVTKGGDRVVEQTFRNTTTNEIVRAPGIDGKATIELLRDGDALTLLFAAFVVGGDAGDAITGSDGADTVQGGAGDDTLTGGVGADRIEGDDGADRIVGGAGVDTLTGGAGSDVFVFTEGDLKGYAPGKLDRIVDFTAGDRLDLSDIDDFTVVSAAGFDRAGQARVVAEGNNTRLELNLDTDAGVEFAILLVGTVSFGSADI